MKNLTLTHADGTRIKHAFTTFYDFFKLLNNITFGQIFGYFHTFGTLLSFFIFFHDGLDSSQQTRGHGHGSLPDFSKAAANLLDFHPATRVVTNWAPATKDL